MGKYAIVSENNPKECWGIGNDKNGMQQRIDSGYYHKFMYEKDKGKKLIIIERK